MLKIHDSLLKLSLMKDALDGKSGHKPKKIEYHDDPYVDPAYGKDIKMPPSKFLRYASGDTGNRVSRDLEDAHSNSLLESTPYKVDEIDYDAKKPFGSERKYKDPMTTDTNYNVRGDELGAVEAYQRKIRQGDSIGKPNFSIASDKKQVSSHEGRNRSVALQREGEKKIPTKLVAYSGQRARELGIGDEPNRYRKDMKGIKRQNNARSNDKKDTRHPIFGRKKAIDKLKALSKELNISNLNIAHA